jgi:short-subunit dehydrogenase
MKFKKALITGGSSGIGLQLVYALLKQGVDCLIVGIILEEVNEVVKIAKGDFPDRKIEGLVQDLRIISELNRILDYCRKKDWDIDLLVNNAGYARSGMPGDLTFEDEAGMLELHCLAYLKLSHLFLPAMIERDKGCIVNLSSISAFQPNPSLGVYGASKAFVFHWSMALREELKMMKKKVQVQTICPTPVVTNFQKNSKMENSILFDTWMTVKPELVVREIMNAIRKDKAMVVPGKLFHFTNKLVGLLPMSWRIKISSMHLKTKK